jgi:hypothetical protein
MTETLIAVRRREELSCDSQVRGDQECGVAVCPFSIRIPGPEMLGSLADLRVGICVDWRIQGPVPWRDCEDKGWTSAGLYQLHGPGDVRKLNYDGLRPANFLPVAGLRLTRSLDTYRRQKTPEVRY